MDTLQPLQQLRPPLNLSHHLSDTAVRRKASNIKKFYKYFLIPGIGQLAGGLPNPQYFPFDTLEARAALPTRWALRARNDTTATGGGPGQGQSVEEKREPKSSHIVVPPLVDTGDAQRKIDVASALQYGTAQGYPALYSFVREFTRTHLHPRVPYEGGPEVVLTCGSTDGFCKAVQALNNEWSAAKQAITDREGLLVEEFAYMNAIQTARPRGMNIVPVPMDDAGMRAHGKDGLEDILEHWDPATIGRRPHLMYTVSVGQNPTGITLPLWRRKEIYALCQKYDIIIIEDDPYWYLQYHTQSPDVLASNEDDAGRTGTGGTASGYPFLDSLVPSYLSIDVDGRVIRLDTFSKTIAPGCRLGWVTGQPALIERILRITECSTQQPSGFVQSLVAELIRGPSPEAGDESSNGAGANGRDKGGVRGWDMSGWVRWLEGLRGEYERRMERTCDILDSGAQILACCAPPAQEPAGESNDATDEWTVITSAQAYSFGRPHGGMFVWLRFHFSTHPLSHRFGEAALSKALWVLWTTSPYRVLVAPGTMFAATDAIRDRSGHCYFRVCFAAAPADELDPVVRRLVSGVADFWHILDPDRIKELLASDDEDDDGSSAACDGLANFGGMC